MGASLVPTEGGSIVPLEKPIVLIGRHQECDVSLQTSSKVSRRHCCIVQVGERYVLRDLGSMNGIRVNGHRIVETELHPGDEVAVADVLFRFRWDDAPQRAARGAVPVARPAEARAPADEPISELPLEISEADEPMEDYETPKPGQRSEIRLKDDSHVDQAPVSV
jgi:pSer/pThr/pTyr-binding forkhead associated (FHA) protein